MSMPREKKAPLGQAKGRPFAVLGEAKGRSPAALGALIKENPKLLRFLSRHGIHFCAGCFLTLFSTPERAAAYHGVPHPKKFAADLARFLSGRAGHRRH